MPEFFKKQGWKSQVTETNNLYTFAHSTPSGMTMWEYVDSFPDRLKNLNFAMMAQTQATMWTIGIFPFEEELKKVETSDDTVLLVDIGGGRGQATLQIRAMCKDIKGRMILQDRKEVTDSLTVEELPGIELMAYDFFTPQPVKGMSIETLIAIYRNC